MVITCYNQDFLQVIPSINLVLAMLFGVVRLTRWRASKDCQGLPSWTVMNFTLQQGPLLLGLGYNQGTSYGTYSEMAHLVDFALLIANQSVTTGRHSQV